jgi:WD40 repeat protein
MSCQGDDMNYRTNCHSRGEHLALLFLAVSFNIAIAQPESVTIKAHDDMVCGLALSGDGKTLASGSFDKTVKLWDFGSQKGTSIRSCI